MKRWLLVIVFVLLPATAWGACSGSSPSWSCSSWADAKALIEGDSLVTGDTVTLSAGTYDTGTDSITIPDAKKITITGAAKVAGAWTTILTRTTGKAIDLENSGSRVTLIDFQWSACVNVDAGVIEVSHTGWRVDNNRFQCQSGAKFHALKFSNQGKYYTAGGGWISIGGVFHDNTCINMAVDTYGSAFGLNANAFAYHGKALGLGTDEAVYIEDNTFTSDLTGAHNLFDGNYSGAYVIRFNTITKNTPLATGAVVEVHGLQTATDFRAVKKWEFYNNTINIGTTSGNRTMDIRGGTGMVFNNTVNVTGSPTNRIWYDLRRAPSGDGTPACDGTQTNYDGNDADPGNGYLCRDQRGAGADSSYYDGSLPLPAQNKVSAYSWGNGSMTVLLDSTASGYIVANRDFYDADATNCAAAGTSCTAGVGVKTRSQLNATTTCVVGVAVWVTDEGYWNSKVAGADGVLYKCTQASPAVWTPYYVPYPYPHPLRSGLSAPTGVTAE